MTDIKVINKLLKQAAFDSCITCGGCETDLEADCPKCGICGWVNPLVNEGFI